MLREPELCLSHLQPQCQIPPRKKSADQLKSRFQSCETQLWVAPIIARAGYPGELPLLHATREDRGAGGRT